jgi:hypothetical protein
MMNAKLVTTVTTRLVRVVQGEPLHRVDCRDRPGNDGVEGAVIDSAIHRVIPAKAGTLVFFQPSQTEVPAFAGMTPWVGYGPEQSHD